MLFTDLDVLLKYIKFPSQQTWSRFPPTTVPNNSGKTIHSSEGNLSLKPRRERHAPTVLVKRLEVRRAKIAQISIKGTSIRKNCF